MAAIPTIPSPPPNMNGNGHVYRLTNGITHTAHRTNGVAQAHAINLSSMSQTFSKIFDTISCNHPAEDPYEGNVTLAKMRAQKRKNHLSRELEKVRKWDAELTHSLQTNAKTLPPEPGLDNNKQAICDIAIMALLLLISMGFGAFITYYSLKNSNLLIME